MTTWYIVEFGCSSWSGHRCGGAMSLSHDLQRRDHEAKVLISQSCPAELSANPSVMPSLTLPVWPPISRDSRSGVVETFSEYGRRGGAELAAALPNISADDVVLLYTASQNEIHALVGWLAEVAPECRPIVIANIALPTFIGERQSPAGEVATHLRASVRLLCSIVPPSRRLFATYTDKMSHAFKELTGINCLVVPNPIAFQPSDAPPSKPPGRTGPIRVAALGQFKGTKGSNTLPAIAEGAKGLVLEILVQDWRAPDIPSNVRRLASALTPKEYNEALASCHVGLMVYDPAFYSVGVSAIFDEAVSLGQVIVCSKDTWMAEQLEAHDLAGRTVPFADSAATVAALADVAANFDDLTTKAGERASLWRSERGTSGYVDMIGRHFRHAAPHIGAAITSS